MTYRVDPYRESINGFAWYVVWAIHGRCGCGEVEMKSRIGLFESKEDAELFVQLKRGQAFEKKLFGFPLSLSGDDIKL
jgi:hypothetical protein